MTSLASGKTTNIYTQKLETVLQITLFSMFIRELQDFLWQGLEINLLAISCLHIECVAYS